MSGKIKRCMEKKEIQWTLNANKDYYLEKTLREKGPWKGGFMNWSRLGKRFPLDHANRITKKAVKKLIK